MFSIENLDEGNKKKDLRGWFQRRDHCPDGPPILGLGPPCLKMGWPVQGSVGGCHRSISTEQRPACWEAVGG